MVTDRKEHESGKKYENKTKEGAVCISFHSSVFSLHLLTRAPKWRTELKQKPTNEPPAIKWSGGGAIRAITSQLQQRAT